MIPAANIASTVGQCILGIIGESAGIKIAPYKEHVPPVQNAGGRQFLDFPAFFSALLQHPAIGEPHILIFRFP